MSSDGTRDTDSEVQRLAKIIAETAGENVYVGSRPHNDTAFAGCGGVELDASTYVGALRGLAEELARKGHSIASDGKRKQEQGERLAALRDVIPDTGGTK